MAEVVIIPRLGFNMDEGRLVRWHKQMDKKAKKGEVLFEINTDKTIMPVKATEDGTLLKIILEEDTFAEIFTPVAMTGVPGEDPDTVLASAGQGQAGGSASAAAPSAPIAPVDIKSLRLTPKARKLIQDKDIDPASLTQIKGTSFQGRVTYEDLKASPLARRVAQQMGVDLVAVRDTGAAGEIMKADVEVTPASAGADTRQMVSAVPYKGVRRIVGERLARSRFTTPHLYFTDAVDTTRLATFHKRLNEISEVKVAVSDLLTMTACRTLKKFPGVNITPKDDQVVTYKSINVGATMAGDNDLVVPVTKSVQNKTLTDITRESKDLVARAREGRLTPEEYSKGTFSISNLEMFGIGNFTAITNALESAILSVSSVRKAPIAVIDENEEDAVAIRPMVNMQLSVDHRIIDDLLTPQFMECTGQLLKHPIQILM